MDTCVHTSTAETFPQMRGIIRKGLLRLLTLTACLEFAALMYRRKVSRSNSLEGCINIAFDTFDFFPFRPWSIRPAQVREEVEELLKILMERRPRIMLEIGTAAGGTLFLFARVAGPEAVLVSIDLPGGEFGGGYPQWRVPLYRSFVSKEQGVHLILGDSHAMSTLSIVERILNPNRLDFLFIDGDHTYEGVKNDFEMYGKLVGKGGTIAIHDICPHPPETGCQVSKFWREIKNEYRHTEIIRDENQKWAGIGVVYL